jgi:hypothetical protein
MSIGLNTISAILNIFVTPFISPLLAVRAIQDTLISLNLILATNVVNNVNVTVMIGTLMTVHALVILVVALKDGVAVAKFSHATVAVMMVGERVFALDTTFNKY